MIKAARYFERASVSNQQFGELSRPRDSPNDWNGWNLRSYSYTGQTA